MVDNLHAIKDLGGRIRTALEAGDAATFGRIMDEHWRIKQARSGGMSNPRIDALYAIARDHGALGGKLVGAGGGGSLIARKRVVSGKGVSEWVHLGGPRIVKKKKTHG